MGNRAKRVKLAKILKSKGLGRLYKTGHKRKFWKEYGARFIKYYCQYFSREIGELVHDCDGFNHVIKAYDREAVKNKWDRANQYVFEDGRWSCGCGPVDDPMPRSEIEGAIVAYWDNFPDELAQASDEQKEVYRILKAGGHICDERGIKLENV